MVAKIHTLSNGIVIRDSRSLGLGCFVENNPYRNIELHYSNQFGEFYLNVSGGLFNKGNIEDFIQRLTEMQAALNEANAIINT